MEQKDSSITFSISPVCDRLDLIDDMKARQTGFDSYSFDRLDMFRVYVMKGEKTLFYYFVEPHVDGSFSLCFQGFDVDRDVEEIRVFAEWFFRQSVHYTEMQDNMKRLVDAGYFEDGRYPGKDTARCPKCASTFKKKFMSLHEHVKIDGDKIVPHNGKMYFELQKRGLKVSWRPGISVDTPSLEDSQGGNISSKSSKKSKLQ